MDNTRACFYIVGNDSREKEWLITQEREGITQGAKSLRLLEQLGSRTHVGALPLIGGINICRWVIMESTGSCLMVSIFSAKTVARFSAESFEVA